MKKLFSAAPLWPDDGISFIRIITGLLMVYHGVELFDRDVMEGYAGWETFKVFSSPYVLVYTGKTAELVSGVLLTLGFLTRIAALILVATMCYILFFIGHGKFWYEDQHPFLFVLLALVFIFSGPGSFSLDHLIGRYHNRGTFKK